MDNALLLVVGYTDSTGSQELNQELSEKRAGRVVNHLQQACGWKPYRMLSPTGMADDDPAADNRTPEGKAQNRPDAENILVSKGLAGIEFVGRALARPAFFGGHRFLPEGRRLCGRPPTTTFRQ